MGSGGVGGRGVRDVSGSPSASAISSREELRRRGFCFGGVGGTGDELVGGGGAAAPLGGGDGPRGEPRSVTGMIVRVCAASDSKSCLEMMMKLCMHAV